MLPTTKLKRYLWSTLSGVLFFVSFPYTGSQTWIGFIAWVPLLLVEHHIAINRYKPSKVLIQGYISFLIYNLGATWWIWHASAGGAIFAITLNALLMALTFWIAHLIKRKLPKGIGYLALIATWISFEYAHYWWELSWPWLNVGNIFSIQTNWVQWYNITGVLGGTCWVLICNILLMLGIVQYSSSKSKAIRFGITYMLIIALPILISTSSSNSYTAKDNLNVCILQPNVDPIATKFSTSPDQQLIDLLALADEHITKQTDLIVGPETALVASFDEDNFHQTFAAQRLETWLQNHPNTEILIGASTYRFFLQKRSRASIKLTGGPGYIEQYNTALYLNSKSNPRYVHKSKLVLGVEKIPYSNMLPFLEDLAIQNGGTSGTLGIEDNPQLISMQKANVATQICYESIYGEYVAQQNDIGSNILAIITNDGWWSNTPGHKQHLSFARLRAIENRKYVIRSANTGISAVINPSGTVLKQTSYWKKDAINASIPLIEEKTFYNQMGDWIGKLASYIFLACALFVCYKSITGPAIASRSV